MITHCLLATLSITPETPLLLPIGLLCTLVGLLILATWRLANFIRDLRDEVRNTWSFRDQERWALTMERENRSRGYKVFVPDVVRAPKEAE